MPGRGAGTTAGMTAPALPPTTAALPSGAAIPLLGFGTWRLSGPTATEATASALAAGYRHVDTATIYRNEREVGAAVRDSGLARDEVFVTTKLPPDQAGTARTTLEQSLELLGLDHLDLWLIHWPPPAEQGLELWRAFLSARDDGLVRDVGVSNYSLEALDALTQATGVTPAVNQIKWSPLLFDAALLAGHRERGVVVEGYSGLKGGTMQQPVVTGISARIGCSPAQVLIRWQLDHGVVAIPKSANESRIRENADVGAVTLTSEDMTELDALADQ